MKNYNMEKPSANIVGSFVVEQDVEFGEGFRSLMESFSSSYDLDAVSDLTRILRSETTREAYKDALMEDVYESSQFENDYMNLLPAKLEQLFENSVEEILTESQAIGQMAPIVGLSLPILKKNYLECHAKDIVMMEVPDGPIIKNAFERKFLKDKQGNKHYIPEIFYDDAYKEVLDKTRGKAVVSTFQPAAGTLPVQDLDVLALSGGSLETRDTLSGDFHIEAVKVQVGAEEIIVDGLFIQGEKSNKGAFTYTVNAKNSTGETVKEMISGQIDFYSGKVSISSTGSAIKQVRFGGHLSNENNMETVELDREREILTWEIPDGARLNTGFTIEKVKDMKALFDIDLINDLIGDMTGVLTQMEDSTIMNYLDDSLTRWRNRYDLPFGYQDGFTESYEFSATPTANIAIPAAQWVESQLKYNLNREIDQLKKKLKTTEIMFVVYGNPSLVSLIQDSVKWVIDESTKVGGIQLDYAFGVMTQNKNRIHVVSSMKVPEEAGLRIVAFPTSKEVITFKHYKYSLNIENSYRNPFTTLTPNIMATSRYLTKEVLPVQGEFKIKDADFGRKTVPKP